MNINVGFVAVWIKGVTKIQWICGNVKPTIQKVKGYQTDSSWLCVELLGHGCQTPYSGSERVVSTNAHGCKY